MLSPEYLQRIAEGAEDIAGTLHTALMDRIIARMMARLGRGENYIFTSTDAWQVKILQDAGYLLSDLQKEIAKKTKLQTKEIKNAMTDAGVKCVEYDNRIFEKAGISTESLAQSPQLVRILERNYNATNGEWKNFARTTAKQSQRLFISEMDKAYTQVITGGESYTKAVRDAIENVSSAGVTVEYNSGRKISIESAAMMIVRTGVAQATGEITMQRLREKQWGIVLVSAHLGARNKGGIPENHEMWQGKFYSLPEYDHTFPDFYTQTGYGDVTGLCGVNCRHSFGAGDGENNPYKEIDTEENRRVYELSQRQRLLERRIRKTKREVQNMQTAVKECKDEKLKFELQQDLDRKSYTLKRQNHAYDDFCEKNSLKKRSDRVRIAQWSRSQAAKATAAARRYEAALGE